MSGGPTASPRAGRTTPPIRPAAFPPVEPAASAPVRPVDTTPSPADSTTPPPESGETSGRPDPRPTPHLVLVSGASGSGKSRLARHTDCLQFRLDDFYYDADHPGHVMTGYGIIDWDDPASWNATAAVDALRTLIEDGEVEVPLYSISENRATGRHTVHLDDKSCIIAEGIFAIELRAHLDRAGLPATAIYLDRPGWLVFLLRLRRDLALKRKPPLVLLRRGWALWRAQPALRRKAVAAGFTPLSMREALAAVQHP